MKTFSIIPFSMTLLLAGSLAVMTGLLASCHKTGLATDTPDAQISFYSASEYLLNQVQQSYNGAKILIDTPDTTTRPDGSSLYLPAFSGNGSNVSQFPNLSQSWISYMRIPAGMHTIILTDTSRQQRPLAYNRVSSVHGEPMTIYYADSLGQFRTWPLLDTAQVTANNFAVRVIDLSPDAGNVFFTINGQSAAGLPDSLQYGGVTPFVYLPSSVTDTLQFRFYNAGDSVDIVALASLYASPGHAYNLLLQGYQNAQSYPDQATGQTLTFNPDLKTAITQIK